MPGIVMAPSETFKGIFYLTEIGYYPIQYTNFFVKRIRMMSEGEN